MTDTDTELVEALASQAYDARMIAFGAQGARWTNAPKHSAPGEV